MRRNLSTPDSGQPVYSKFYTIWNIFQRPMVARRYYRNRFRCNRTLTFVEVGPQYRADHSSQHRDSIARNRNTMGVSDAHARKSITPYRLKLKLRPHNRSTRHGGIETWRFPPPPTFNRVQFNQPIFRFGDRHASLGQDSGYCEDVDPLTIAGLTVQASAI